MNYAHRQTYELNFSDRDWEELVSLTFEPFEFGYDEPLTRGQWLALAHMALGKAQLIDDGQYDIGDGHDSENPEWAAHLRSIAHRILDEFQPADGKI